MSQFFGETFLAVESAMRFRVARQGMLAANVANTDTPGYQRSDLNFVERFDRAVSLRTADPSHIAGAETAVPGRVAHDRSPGRVDGNNVNLDRELVRLSRNAGAFSEQAAVLSRLIELHRTAIDGRG